MATMLCRLTCVILASISISGCGGPVSWSPDSKHVYFTNSRGDVLRYDIAQDSTKVISKAEYVAQKDTGSPHLGTATWLSVQPNGKSLAIIDFTRSINGIRPNKGEFVRMRLLSLSGDELCEPLRLDTVIDQAVRRAHCAWSVDSETLIAFYGTQRGYKAAFIDAVESEVRSRVEVPTTNIFPIAGEFLFPNGKGFILLVEGGAPERMVFVRVTESGDFQKFSTSDKQEKLLQSAVKNWLLNKKARESLPFYPSARWNGKICQIWTDEATFHLDVDQLSVRIEEHRSSVFRRRRDDLGFSFANRESSSGQRTIPACWGGYFGMCVPSPNGEQFALQLEGGGIVVYDKAGTFIAAPNAATAAVDGNE